MLILCNNGHKYDQLPYNTIMGFGCRFCAGNARELGKEHFEQAVKERGGEILGQYSNNRTKLPFYVL